MGGGGAPGGEGENGWEVTVAQALATDRSGKEFLELLGSVLSVEDKSSGRYSYNIRGIVGNRNRRPRVSPPVPSRSSRSGTPRSCSNSWNPRKTKRISTTSWRSSGKSCRT